MRPLQVYLDSSDFSVLADPTKRTKEIISLEEQLISWRDAGLIEIRFAYPHLVEAAPIAPQHIEAFRCRAKKIAELCQGKAIAALDKIFAAEIKTLVGEPAKSGYVFMDDGDWMPDISDISTGPDEFFDHAKQIPKITAEMGLSKGNTRRVLKQFIRPDGKLRAPAKEFLKKGIPATVEAICEQYPLDKEYVLKFAHELLNGTLGKNSYDPLFNSFRNLPNFAEWFAQHFDQTSPTVTWLRKTGDSIRNSILENRQTIENIYSTQTALGISNDAISAMAKERLVSMIERLPKTLLPRIAEKYGCIEFPTMELRELSEKAPSLFTAISVMGGITRRTLQPLANERNPKVSDMGDVIHSL
ncbi:MAG: hypothetical protein WB870_05505 [Gallionellaceae bacterium]